MIESFGIALSGLNAVSKKLNNTANNVANQFSTLSNINGETVKTPYKPQDVNNVSLEPGGVTTNTRPTEPGSIPVYDPENSAADADGITQYPNVDPEKEVVNQLVDKNEFKANLNVIKTQDKMLGDLLDILA